MYHIRFVYLKEMLPNYLLILFFYTQEYNIGGPTSHPPTGNWEMFPDTTQLPPIIGGPGPGAGPMSGIFVYI